MKTLAIFATHPIQYYAPLYRETARTPDLRAEVFYGRLPTPDEQGEGFGVPFAWDVDLLSGYPHRGGAPARTELLEGLRARRWSALLLHGWHHPLEREVMAAALRSGVPVLVRGDTHLRAPRPWWRRLAREVVLRRRLARCAACLAVGTWNAEFYRHFGVSEERIVRSPHCVDHAFFRAETARLTPRRDALRGAWGVGPGDALAVFVGKFIPEKNVEDFVAALASAARSGARIRGLLVGDGPLRVEMERRASAAGAPAHFAGFLNQSRVAEAYVAADVVVLPSRSETWGLVVNEALVCGKPCLVSDRVGAAPDLIAPGVTGAVFPCGDREGLAARLIEMVSGRAQFSPGSAEWEAVVERHSCAAAARGISEALRRFGLPETSLPS
ncbi:MAG: glycosyltransferase family 4 protein [Verrucomicrobiae bacterium]|nr:glycosyltransferase family 4 protein [Verrucomicrobiae bacterium]